MIHLLKTDPAGFERTLDGYKDWEIRFNDRNFQSGDELCLQETQFTGAEMAAGQPLVYTGREQWRDIIFVMTPGLEVPVGLQEGYVAMSTARNDFPHEHMGQVDA